MTNPARLSILALVVLAAIGCDDTSGDVDSGPTADAGGTVDGGSATDAGDAMDAGEADAGSDAGSTDAGSDAGPTDAGSTDAGPTDAGPTDAGPTDAGPTDAGEDAGTIADGGLSTCTAGSEAEVGQLCVVGATAGGEVTFQVVPTGCLSSTCTIRHTTRCAATRSGSTFELDALFCLGRTDDLICSADCSGGGFANCGVGSVEAGTYTATLGGLSLTFSVPSEIPLGGICVGTPL